MTKRELYEKAYNILANLTPLQSDCGELCNRACCDSADEDAGMYLFPGEEIMYFPIPAWLRIEKSKFIYGDKKPALIAMCPGRCDRELRPLSCRIFPLTPYIGHNGVMGVKIDPRAVPICPLAKPYAAKRLDEGFIHAVEDAFKILAEDKEIKTFIFDLSRLIDEQEIFLRRFATDQRKRKLKRGIRWRKI